MHISILFCLFFSMFVYANDIYKKQYIEPNVLNTIPIFPIATINTVGERASERDLNIIKQYYRHTNIVDKVSDRSYITISFIYTMPTGISSNNELSANKGSPELTQAVINNFNTNYRNNLTLNGRNFGLGFVFGSQVSFSVKREFELLLYQASNVYFIRNPNQQTADPSGGRLQIVYKQNDVDITASFDNAEYIKRNISFHYNIQKDFNGLFSKTPNTFFNKLTPFISVGGGISSRVTFLRLSNGFLGDGNEISDVITNVNYLKLMPSFGVGVGLRYQFSDNLAFNLKVNSIQVINDINFAENYIVQSGLVIFL
jgi:hypothetical protein